MKSVIFLKTFYIVVISFCLLITSCGKEERPKSSLIVRDNILYKEGSDVPFTGRERAFVENKIIEYDVKDGYKHGEFRIYSEEGNIEIQGQLDSNRNVGKWQYFYPDGILESEGFFNMDSPDGKWIWNYADGRIKEEGVYKNGIRIGMWFRYDSTGKVIYNHNYELADSVTDSSSI